MNNLNEFITEIPTLEIKGDQYLTLEHYNQHHSDYECDLKRLQQLALNDILLLKPEQIRLQLTRFKQIHERFAKFWKVYKELFEQFKADKLQLIDLELKLYPLFIVPKHPASIISEQFLFDLHDAVMFKQDFFEGFEAQVQKVLNEHKTEFQFTHEQEVTEERKKNLQKQLSKLKSIDEKILFLKTEKANYLQNLPPRTLEVSGSVHANFAPGAEFFFDRYIQIEIDKLEAGNKKGGLSKSKHEQPDSFDALFKNPALIDPCINILKQLDPPLINDECSYIGKSKGAFCIWINEMLTQGIIEYYADRNIYASLLPQKIKNFSIDGSLFAKPNKRAKDSYGIDIKTLLSQVKLSQDSQKGKLGE